VQPEIHEKGEDEGDRRGKTPQKKKKKDGVVTGVLHKPKVTCRNVEGKFRSQEGGTFKPKKQGQRKDQKRKGKKIFKSLNTIRRRLTRKKERGTAIVLYGDRRRSEKVRQKKRQGWMMKG